MLRVKKRDEVSFAKEPYKREGEREKDMSLFLSLIRTYTLSHSLSQREKVTQRRLFFSLSISFIRLFCNRDFVSFSADAQSAGCAIGSLSLSLSLFLSPSLSFSLFSLPLLLLPLFLAHAHTRPHTHTHTHKRTVCRPRNGLFFSLSLSLSLFLSLSHTHTKDM